MGGSSKIILGMLLGGMITVDMGGPINKAAYVFGTASIASGNYDIMAAVMIGGMVPPLAIALATFFFKNRFTEKEQQTTLTNIIMELSFICSIRSITYFTSMCCWFYCRNVWFSLIKETFKIILNSR